MSQIFKALADPNRRRILELLRQRDMSAGEIAEHFTVSKPTLSKHFQILQHADLIQGERNGTTITYSLNLSVLEEAIAGFMNLFSKNSERNSSWKSKTRK